MFGKKKNVEGDAEAAPAEPKKGGKAKSGKGGRTLAKGGPNVFALHGEKIGMALIVGAAGFFVYQGLTTESFKSKGQSAKLKSDASQLMTDISNPHWDAIAEEREFTEDYEPVFNPLVDKVRTPTDASLYVNTQMVWEPKQMPVSGKRGDPDVLPPINLLASNFFGAVAVVVDENANEAFSTWDDAEPITARRRGRGNDQPDNGGSPYGGDEGLDGGGLGPAPGGGSGDNKKIRRVNAEYDLGVSLPGTGGDSGGGMYGDGAGLGDGGMGGMDGMGLGGMGGGGLGGRGAGSTGGSDDGLGSGRDNKPKTRVSTQGIAFNAITAVVPHKEMVELYDAAFENTGAFYADRDLPYYLSFEVQRVDVTDDPSRAVKEDEWKDVTDGLEQYNLGKKRKWANRADGVTVPEVIDRNYAVPQRLTMPIPPVVMRDYREFSRHPMIPWSWDAKPLRDEDKPKQEDNDDGEEEDDGALLPGSEDDNRGGGMGGIGGMGGDDMYGGDMYGGGLGGMGDDDEYGDDDMYGGDMYGGDMYGDGMGGMGGDMYGGGSSNTKRKPQPEFKMIRCYDIVGPKDVGKVYRYRIRVAMRNPNYPETDKVPAPLPSQLKDDVWAEISKIKKQDEIRRKKDPKRFLRTLKYTEWSEPSTPVLVRTPSEVFAGVVEPSRNRKYTLSVSNQKVDMEVISTEPRSTVIAARMDPKSGAMLTAMAEGTVRGGMLNIDRGDIDIIIPETKNVKTNGRKRKVALNTNSLIVDMRGGEALAVDSNDDPMFANGEVLVLHQDGRLEVTSDISDALEFRMYSFADQREAAAKASRKKDDKNQGGYGDGYGGDEGGLGM